MDKRAGVGTYAPAPPAPFAPPPIPIIRAPEIPKPAVWEASVAAGAGSAAGLEEASRTRPFSGPLSDATQPERESSKPVPEPGSGGRFLRSQSDTLENATGYSYADEVEQGIACAKCTHGHLRAMAASSKEAEAAVLVGDPDRARALTARVLAESAVLREYDWTPAKVRNTPDEERRLVEQAMPCVRDAERQADGPPKELVLAWGSLDESVRFARSSRLSDQDKAEIETRLRRYYDTADMAERVLAAPNIRDNLEDREAKRVAAQHLREARHALEAGSPYDAAVLEEASAHLEAAAVAMTPVPSPERAQRLAETCRTCRTEFEDSYLDLIRSRR